MDFPILLSPPVEVPLSQGIAGTLADFGIFSEIDMEVSDYTTRVTYAMTL